MFHIRRDKCIFIHDGVKIKKPNRAHEEREKKEE
jgi:hypothetical protein